MCIRDSSDGERAAVKCYGANDVLEGVAIMKHEGCLLYTSEQGNLNYIVPQLIAVALTAGVHLWRKNTRLSIAVGTIGYMLLIHFVFVLSLIHI